MMRLIYLPRFDMIVLFNDATREATFYHDGFDATRHASVPYDEAVDFTNLWMQTWSIEEDMCE